MMYMDDAVEATIKLMEADPSKLTIRTSYNIHAMDFTPLQIANEVKKHHPDF
jgi:nucleoside-diphosphate-sugar epimerase